MVYIKKHRLSQNHKETRILQNNHPTKLETTKENHITKHDRALAP
jgi:hypothetical protein